MNTTKTEKKTVREAVGVFSTVEALQAAIDELETSGFARAEFSLLAGEKAVEEKLGHVYKKASELEDDPKALRAAYVSTESIGDAEGALIGAPLYIAATAAAGIVAATGGTLAAVIAATSLAGGAGALIGAALAGLVGKHHADYIEEQLEHGGLLLWVRTWDAEREERAKEILSRHSAADVHAHDLPVEG